MFGPLQWSVNSNSSRWSATALTPYAPALCRAAGWTRENAADDDAGKQMPRLRLQANLDGHVIRADFIQQIVELIKRPDGERAGGLKEHLKGAWAVPQTSGWAVRCDGVLIVDS
jgi:hypothetical protein